MHLNILPYMNDVCWVKINFSYITNKAVPISFHREEQIKLFISIQVKNKVKLFQDIQRCFHKFSKLARSIYSFQNTLEFKTVLTDTIEFILVQNYKVNCGY